MCIKCDVLCHNELVGIQIRKKEGFYSPPNINEQRKREQNQKQNSREKKKHRRTRLDAESRFQSDSHD